MTQRSLTNTGGPTRHRIGAFAFGFIFSTPKMLEDALLDFFQSEVILIEHLPGMCDVEIVVGALFHGNSRTSSR